MKPYVIVSPAYDYVSGGIKVVWALYGHLLARGIEVYMNQAPNNRDFIAVYPEIYHGNIANAPKVVRYILNRPGVMGANGVPGPTTFDSSDTLYYFSQLFSDKKEKNILFLPVIDLFTFKVTNKGKRPNACKFIGKGFDTHSKETNELPTLDRSFARDQQALSEYLNTCEVMYCFDPCSAMIEVARLCGCRVVMLNNTQYSKEKFSVYEPGMNGITWGNEETNVLDADKFREHYKMLIEKFNKDLGVFIKDTQI